MSGHRDDGTYAEDTAHHEGRKIVRMNKTFAMPEGQAGINAMRATVDAKLGSRDTGPSIADIRSAVNSDDAPAGGIKRPEMESCAGCGENTPKGSGSCADCK
jgi:hypothetical protein